MINGLSKEDLIKINRIHVVNFVKKIFPKFIFVLLSCIAFTACENDIAEVNYITAENEQRLPIESGKDVEMLYSDSAIVRAKLKSPQVDRYVGKTNYMLLPKGMLVIFYDEDKQEETKLTADYGIGFDNGSGMNKMEAKKNVVVVNKKGEKLNTEHLIWDATTKKIYTDKFVKITTEDEVLFGDGLIANQDFSEWEIKNPKGVISIDEAKEKESEEKNKTNE